MTLETILGWFAQLIAAGGGGAVVAYVVFKYLGDNWIKHHLAKDLEAAKSEISLLAARKLKLHDQEYIVFPEVWAKLNKAVTTLGVAVSLIKEYTNLSRMNDEQLHKWLERSDLEDHEKEYLLSESDKNRAYGKIIDWRDLQRALKASHDFRTYFKEKRIFIDPEIKSKLDEIDDLLHSIWVDRKMSLKDFGSRDTHKFWTDAWEDYNKKVKLAMTEIEILFQKKLFPNVSKEIESKKEAHNA